VKRKCLTPGALFHCYTDKPNAVGQTSVHMGVTIPSGIVISRTRAAAIDRAFHDALEKTMAPWWPKQKEQP
jgi:hypothetical protein